MQQIIHPIIYEDNDSAKIRRAFNAGCGGVIVTNKLPNAVTAEMQKLEEEPGLLEWLRDKSLFLTTDKVDPRQLNWSRDVPEIYETCGWLEEQYLRSAATKSRQGAPQKKDQSYMMLAWFGDEIKLPWHIDKKGSVQQHPDIHVHVHGPGLVVASPPHSIKLPFNQLSGSPYLQITSDNLKGESVDTYLQNRGFQLITMQPGQTLFLKEMCLHKSAPMDTMPLKCRAAAF